MLALFKQHIQELIPRPEQMRYLLAISGGIDSMVMADMFIEAGYNVTIAHCNFQLRGKESEADEDFVRHYARIHNTPFHVKRFGTEKYAVKHKLSIQMAAREIRYEWLLKLGKEIGCGMVCIAHNSNDAVETFFINLLRGTGISGLTGISAIGAPFEQNNGVKVLRPLLNFSRSEIEEYAKKRKIAWREDSSNATDKYLRNRIRHHLLPLLEELQPHAAQAIRTTMKKLHEAEAVYLDTVNSTTQSLLKRKGERIYIDKNKLLKLQNNALFLYEALKSYNFNATQANEILAALRGIPGKVFLSSTHRITSDRRYMSLEKKDTCLPAEVHIIKKSTEITETNSCSFHFTVKMKNSKFTPPSSPLTAYIDYEKLKFPLILRRWERGDKFHPLGMKNFKKVSDLLINSKVSLPDKERIYVLVSDSKIVWVSGIRLDNRFKITSTTKKMYICKLENCAPSHQ